MSLKRLKLFPIFVFLFFLVFANFSFSSEYCRKKGSDCHSCCEELEQIQKTFPFTEAFSNEACCVLNLNKIPSVAGLTQEIQSNFSKVFNHSYSANSQEFFVQKETRVFIKPSLYSNTVPIFILKDSYLI